MATVERPGFPAGTDIEPAGQVRRSMLLNGRERAGNDG